MKNSIFKSFRFEIIIYSILSLICTFITEAGIGGLIYFIRIISKKSVENQLINEEAGRLNFSNTLNQLYPMEGIREPEKPMGQMVILVILFIVVFSIVLFALYFFLMTKKLSLYLNEIVVGIKNMSEGNFDSRIVVKGNDEFADIAVNVNEMVCEVRRIIDIERTSEARKNDLITNVAHDLRTPLTSIIGYLELVSAFENTTEETRQKYIKIAYDKSKRLEKLIEDLFAYTKLSFGEVSMNIETVDIVKLIEQLLEEFYPSFQENNLDYEFITEENTLNITADGDLLARALANLISNGIKYGRNGKSIKIYLEKNTDIIIRIVNFGDIIPPEDIDNIFEKFYRIESSRSSETGGSGLGLTIAKNIILMHNGMLTVKSDMEGTVFTIVLKEGKCCEKEI